MAVFVKFWGTRGSIPTPASWTRVYGGNTSCVEVRFDKTIFICDAGSGIRELGKDLALRTPVPTEMHLLITHTHWDHIQGFPFFAPAYLDTTRLRVYGKSGGPNSPHAVLSGQMSSDYFPVSFQHLGANIVSDTFESGGKEIEGVCVRTIPLNHPGGCVGYIFEKGGRKIVYLTDNELEIQPGDKFPDMYNDGGLRRVPSELVEYVRDADLLIADAQYDDNEYADKKGWGHSTCISVTDLAIKGDVKNLALYHHDPECSDSQVDAKVRLCCDRATRFGSKISIFAAREGVEMKF